MARHNDNKIVNDVNNKNVNEWDKAIAAAKAQLQEIATRKMRLKAAIKAFEENKRLGVSYLKTAG